jgi:cyclopropane fatty-acyl-phospholipid synthase-like methyltransferase
MIRRPGPCPDGHDMNNHIHYDKVTDAWTFLLGNNLHYGYFSRADETLEQATDALVDTMADLASMNAQTSLLDVGCGIGAPAFRLSERSGCQISAITLSSRGVEMARDAAIRKGLSERVVFYQRDALDNGFPGESFDVVWVMESSHLMRDKRSLCAENYRVLKAGGTMLLCDLILRRELSVMDIYRLRADLACLERSFGKAKMETFDVYETHMRAEGFEKITRRDISSEAFPTLGKWEENLQRNRAALAAHLSEQDIDDFARSCTILKTLFAEEVLGYGIVTGIKPG